MPRTPARTPPERDRAARLGVGRPASERPAEGSYSARREEAIASNWAPRRERGAGERARNYPETRAWSAASGRSVRDSERMLRAYKHVCFKHSAVCSEHTRHQKTSESSTLERMLRAYTRSNTGLAPKGAQSARKGTPCARRARTRRDLRGVCPTRFRRKCKKALCSAGCRKYSRRYCERLKPVRRLRTVFQPLPPSSRGVVPRCGQGGPSSGAPAVRRSRPKRTEGIKTWRARRKSADCGIPHVSQLPDDRYGRMVLQDSFRGRTQKNVWWNPRWSYAARPYSGAITPCYR